MITPVGNTHSNDVQPPAPKPAPPAQSPQPARSGELSGDQVTLKNTGQVEK